MFLAHLCELLPSLGVRHMLSVCKLFQKSSPLKPLGQVKPNLAWIILRGFPLKFMSDSHALHPRWPPLLKIEISSIGQNCSILSQNVPKFELYKHNGGLFNIYYGIFLGTFNFCRFWLIMQIRKRWGWNFKKISETTEPISAKLLKWFLGGPLPKLCPAFQTSDQDGRHSRT